MGVPDLTVAQAAEYPGLSVRQHYNLMVGDLVPRRVGRMLRFEVDALDTFLAAHPVQPGSLAHLVPPQQRDYRQRRAGTRPT